MLRMYPRNIEWWVMCCEQLRINRWGYQALNPIYSHNTDHRYLTLVNYIFCDNRNISYFRSPCSSASNASPFCLGLGCEFNCYCLNCYWLQNKQKLQKTVLCMHSPPIIVVIQRLKSAVWLRKGVSSYSIMYFQLHDSLTLWKQKLNPQLIDNCFHKPAQLMVSR